MASQRKIGPLWALINGVLVGVIDFAVGQPVGHAVVAVAKSSFRPAPKPSAQSSRETPRAKENVARAA
jgi:hypothetical protein